MSKALPKGWKIVALGDVAEEVREYEKEPAKKGIERLVGLEHIDPEDLRSHRWGLVADGTTFTKVFKKGQVLFGRRRAYQKKIAIADFNGVCSGDILVFQTKEGLIPELLPFLMQSENFYNYALDTSAGSLSPRTKWKHLAKFEFPLPPLAEQKRIAEVLWMVENAICKTDDAIGVAERYRKVLMKHLFMYGPALRNTNNEMPGGWTLRRIEDVVDKMRAGGTPLRSKKEYYGGSIPFVVTEDMTNTHKYLKSTKEFLSDDGLDNSSAWLVPKGSILLSMYASFGETVITTIDVATNQAIMALIPNKNICLGQYLYYYLAANRHIWDRHIRETTQKNINGTIVKNEIIKIPPLPTQKRIIHLLSKIDENLDVLTHHTATLLQLKYGLTNSFLSGANCQGGDA